MGMGKTVRRSATGTVVTTLEAFVTARRSLAANDLARLLGCSRAQAHRIAASLTAEGLLARHPATGRLILGPRMARLGLRAAASSSLSHLWHPILDGLVRDIGETCNVVAFPGGTPTYLARIEARWPLTLHFAPGSHVPLHCTASGKLYLSQLGETARSRLLAGLSLAAHTPNTITDAGRLAQHLVGLRAADLATDDEEFVLGMVALGVPIRDEAGTLLAALTVHAPKVRLDLERAHDHLPRLREAADRLARAFEED